MHQLPEALSQSSERRDLIALFSIPYDTWFTKGIRFNYGGRVITIKLQKMLFAWDCSYFQFGWFFFFFLLNSLRVRQNTFGLVVVWKKRNRSLPPSFSEGWFFFFFPYFLRVQLTEYRYIKSYRKSTSFWKVRQKGTCWGVFIQAAKTWLDVPLSAVFDIVMTKNNNKSWGMKFIYSFICYTHYQLSQMKQNLNSKLDMKNSPGAH